MNDSMLTCGWTTHLKIVAVALMAAGLVATVALHARVDDAGTGMLIAKAGGPVVKAGKPAVYATSNADALH